MTTNLVRCNGDTEWGDITMDGEPLDPRPSQEVWNHSPDGFAWGYGGSGPAQLALAILLHAGVDEEDAVKVHQDFKRTFIEPLAQRVGFTLELDVKTWAARALVERGARA